MTKYLFSFLFLVGQNTLGQSTDSINKIIFSYGRSHYSFGEPGVYSKGEEIEITKLSNSNFKLTRYITTTASLGDDRNTYRKDTIKLSIKRSKIISSDKIKFWLTQLNTNKENFTDSFIKPKLTKPTKSEILSVARKYDKIWMLTGESEDYFDKEDKADARRTINKMKRLAQLDSFLIYKQPTIEYDMVVIDSYNSLKILTIQNGDTTEYRCQFFEPLGQPIIRYTKGNYMKSSRVFNLEANTSALTFLPKNSMISRTLSLDNIKEEYIKWYLDRF